MFFAVFSYPADVLLVRGIGAATYMAVQIFRTATK
jgi:hypothetical protein